MRSTSVSQVMSYIRPYYKYQIIGLFFTLLYSTTVFLTPMVSKHLIDNVIGNNSFKEIFSGILVFSVICLAQPVTSYIKDIIFVQIGERTAVDIRGQMYKGILYAPFRTIQTLSSGEIVSRISQDGYMVSRIITELVVGIVKNLVICTMIISGLIILSPLLSIISLALFAVCMAVTSRMSAKFESIQSEVQSKHDLLCRSVDDLVKASAQIKGYGLEQKFEASFDDVLDSVKQINTKAMKQNAKIQTVSNAVMVLILCILYGGGSILVLYDQMTIGTVIGLGLYFQLLMQPVYELIQQKSAIYKVTPILERIAEYERLNKECAESGEKSIGQSALLEGLIAVEGLTLQNISFSYGGNPVIDDISLKLPPKGLVIIEGQSGVGKTTLLNILCGLYYPDSGEISINNSVYEYRLSYRDLRRLVAYVEQQPKVYDYVYDKLYMNEGRLSLGAQSFLKALNKSFLESQDTSTHSGGEMQRQAMIRAVYKDSPIWVFDEPLSALDKANKDLVKTHIRALKKEKLIIIASHLEDWNRDVDVVVTLCEDGHIRARKSEQTA